MRSMMTLVAGTACWALTLLAPKHAAGALDWKQPGYLEVGSLESAMRRGDMVQVQAWLDEGLKVDALFSSEWGKLPLLDFAIMAGNIGAVKFLLAEGAEPEQMAETILYDKESAMKAVKNASLKGLARTDEERERIENEYRRDVETYSPLMFAAANGSLEIAAELIEWGADVNKAGAAGLTALIVAAVHNKPAVVRLLLEKGADVNTALDDSPLLKSISIARLGITLINTRVVPHFFYAPAGATALWLATLAGHKDVVALLVEAKADQSAEASCAQIPEVPTGEKSCNAVRLAELLGYQAISGILGASGVESAVTIRQRDPTLKERTDLLLKLSNLIRQDDPDGLKKYLDGGFDIDGECVTESGYTLLNMAAYFKAIKTMDYLIKHGANVDLMNTVGDKQELDRRYRVKHRSPLMSALENSKCLPCAELLLNAGADVNLVGDEGIPAIAFAANSGKPGILGRLLEAKADLEARVHPQKSQYAPYTEGATPLWIAAATGNVEGVRFLLGAGADPTVEATCGEERGLSKSETTCTPRRIAEVLGRPEVVQLLDATTSWIEKATEIDLLDPKLDRNLFFEGLETLVRRGKPLEILALLERGLDPDTMVYRNGGVVPLVSLAILMAKDAALTLLLDHRADCEKMSKNAMGPQAAMTGFVGTLFMGRIDEKSQDLIPVYSPLMYAAAGEKLAPVELLLKAGANVNTRGLDGTTALMMAAENGRTAIVQRLLAAGAEVDARIGNRERAEHHKEHRATALWLACKSGKVGAIEVLLNAGANPRAEAECRSIKASEGEKECDCHRIAELWGQRAIVELLDRRIPPAAK